MNECFFSKKHKPQQPLGAAENVTRLDLTDFNDSSGQPLESFCKAARSFIAEALANKRSVLVHCAQGVSRSTSICVDFLMHRDGIAYTEALEMVQKVRDARKRPRSPARWAKQVRPIAQPNSDFEQQLKAMKR